MLFLFFVFCKIGASFWLYNGFQIGEELTDDFTEFNLIVGEQTQDATITNNLEFASKYI